MKRIEFSREETRQIVGLLRDYFRDELDQEIGQLPAVRSIADDGSVALPAAAQTIVVPTEPERRASQRP